MPNAEVISVFLVIRFKVCILYILTQMCAFKDQVKDLKFSFAVYDIDADESSSPCTEVQYTGQYNRLKLLRKLSDFMQNYTNIMDCKGVS